ncbi:hypothetical protein CE91St62_35530 [Lachnospiraceae bacterium]|nr:hypothetical protein CE91St61_35650 [Lachnospiraceae bacterium]BDF39492.1 hypothetical protein CE91St62_35530 [Lachnospiraceae bacterium]
MSFWRAGYRKYERVPENFWSIKFINIHKLSDIAVTEKGLPEVVLEHIISGQAFELLGTLCPVILLHFMGVVI